MIYVIDHKDSFTHNVVHQLSLFDEVRCTNYDEIDNLEKNSIDFYSSVKSLYLQDRQQKILNSKQITNTQNDSDWEEIDTQ